MNASIISKGLAHECDGWHCVDDSGTAKLPPAEDRLGEEAFRAMDRMREALSAQITGGLSPALLALAFMDWSIHLASAPGKCAEIIFKADRKIGRLAAHAAAIGIATDDCPCIEPLPGDYRFVSDTWRKPPYSLWAQAFLLNQQWWHNVTHKVAGVTPHHEEVVSFAGRQFPDMFSPSNIPFANPEVVEKTIKSGGQNFVHGFQNWLKDANRLAMQQPPAGTNKFILGKDGGVTTGKVVYRNHLGDGSIFCCIPAPSRRASIYTQSCQLLGRRLCVGDGRFVPLFHPHGEVRRSTDDRRQLSTDDQLLRWGR